MITQDEMRVIDRNSDFFGISIQNLMENAGKAVAENILSVLDGRGKKILFICGTGNNGSDGLTAARILKDDAEATVILAGNVSRITMMEAREAYQKAKGKVKIVEDLDKLDELIGKADIVVDGLLGIGLRGEVKEPYATIITKLNSSGKPILSIDVPSGLGMSIAVKPTVTVALHDQKVGMTEENSGQIVVADIGIPKDVTERVGPGEFFYYPRKRDDSHKGDNGRLLVLGGGPFTGAPTFVGLAAYRVGVDVVHIATPAIVYPVVAAFSPNLIVHQLAGSRFLRVDISQVLELATEMDAMVAGPGLGSTDMTIEAVRELVSKVSVPMVLDADAITAVSKDLGCLQGKKGVITPHAREFLTLTGEKLPQNLSQTAEIVKASAKKLGFTILLKGPVDVISDGESVRYNVTHNSAMTVGGTGDSLAGVVGGLLAKKMKAFDAARLGAFINGYAGNLAYKEKSYGMMTSDLIEKIPNVLLEFVKS